MLLLIHSDILTPRIISERHYEEALMMVADFEIDLILQPNPVIFGLMDITLGGVR